MSHSPLIILGMHRSGTSLVTQWLYRCGLAIGEDLMAGNSGNVQGYFEDNDFVHLHEEILSLSGLPNTGLTDEPLDILNPASKKRIIDLLEKKSRLNQQWGWKDPRTCLFLPIYRELAPDAQFLVLYRDYRACIHSLVQRDLRDERRRYLSSGKRFAAQRWKWRRERIVLRSINRTRAEHYLKVWIHYNKEILSLLDSLPDHKYYVLDYRSLLASDRPAFDRLTEVWNFRLVYYPFSVIYSSSLMSDPANTDKYIKNKSLLGTAQQLTIQLKAFAARQANIKEAP